MIEVVTDVDDLSSTVVVMVVVAADVDAAMMVDRLVSRLVVWIE